MVQWSSESFCTQIQRKVVVYVHDERSEYFERNGMTAIELTNDTDQIVFMVQHGHSVTNAMLHFYHGLRSEEVKNDEQKNNSLLDHSDLIIPL